jgi:hypothetical protein
LAAAAHHDTGPQARSVIEYQAIECSPPVIDDRIVAVTRRGVEVDTTNRAESSTLIAAHLFLIQLQKRYVSKHRCEVQLIIFDDERIRVGDFHLKDLVDINCSPVLDCLEAASARCTPWHQRGSTDHNRIVGRLQQQLDFDLTVQPFVHNAKRFSWELANNVTRGARLPQEFQGIDSQRPQ